MKRIHTLQYFPIVDKFIVKMELLCIENGKGFDDLLISRIVRNENALVKSILERSTDVISVVDSLGSTLLHRAVFYRNITITKYLIDKGTKVDVQDKKGKTPLMLAVENKDYKMIMLLCKYDANVCVVNSDRKNVIQIALATNKMLTAIIELLLHQLSNNCAGDNGEVAKKLVEFNVPLYHIVLLKNAEVTKILLEKHNLNANARNPETGERALHVAVQERDLENVRVLVEHNANVNVRDKSDKTPLFIYGVTSNYPDQKLEILKILLDSGAEYQTIHWYSGTWQCFPLLSEGRREAIRLFLQYNIDLHARDQFDQTPIHYLALNDHPGIFEELEGKDFDVRICDDEGYTPLHKAIGNPSSVEYLLKKGANVDAMTFEDGESALFKAFARGRSKKYARSIELLLQRDAEIQTRTMEGVAIIDLVIRKKKYTYFEPVLAHMVLMKDCGRKKITPYTRRRINSHDLLKRRFKFYKRQLDRMKVNKLRGIVSFYELLTASDEQIAHYVRNPRLVLSLIRIDKKCKIKSYYYNTLRKRLTEAIVKARAKERAAVIVSRIMRITYRGNYVIADTIVNYLCDKDIQRLNQAFS